ncbi:magnesium transporter CorA [Actinoplanes lobatus]|uniref:Magnesium transporter n=1 Tax=Actinoplanes lobatus TaxID=113568 RepID=A0A7W7MIP7_9ACTN|nr:magnesium and cobalt transport protein CorA [Actinoplanes lobatus]MBB4751787.1 magnesium transporter [Actinoplanes lobatus]GGN65740.1 magnesium transporter CorA [Actinoplanes lobatus]GIE43367.1 magnesium transporter CorA [Actinoplanes lobatus]
MHSPAGRRRADHTAIVGCDLFVDGIAVESPGSAADLAHLHERAREQGGFVWLDLHEPTEAALTRVAEVFDLHPLTVEDVLHREQRVKFERYDDVVFLVIRAAHYAEHERFTATSEIVSTGFLRLFAGPHFVIVVRQGTLTELSALQPELTPTPKKLAAGPWSVVHAILDRLMDVYADIVEALRTDADLTEAAVFTPGENVAIEQIYQLKRQLMKFKAAVLPLHRPLATLAGRSFAGPSKDIHRYLRDVAGRHTAVMEEVVALDEVLNALLQARLTQLTVDQNNDMRRIASWAAIAALITTIAGVYGMNFTHMPELGWRYGYPSVALLMLVSASGLYWVLRRAGWL